MSDNLSSLPSMKPLSAPTQQSYPKEPQMINGPTVHPVYSQMNQQPNQYPPLNYNPETYFVNKPLDYLRGPSSFLMILQDLQKEVYELKKKVANLYIEKEQQNEMINHLIFIIKQYESRVPMPQPTPMPVVNPLPNPSTMPAPMPIPQQHSFVSPQPKIPFESSQTSLSIIPVTKMNDENEKMKEIAEEKENELLKKKMINEEKKKELERIKKQEEEAKRLKQEEEAKRLKQEEEAKRLKEEAKRLKQEAKKLKQEEAKRLKQEEERKRKEIEEMRKKEEERSIIEAEKPIQNTIVELQQDVKFIQKSELQTTEEQKEEIQNELDMLRIEIEKEFEATKKLLNEFDEL